MARKLSNAIDLLRVRWLFYDADGIQLTDSNSYYVVCHDDDGLRACVCIQTDDAVKLRILAAKHGIDLTEQTPSAD